MDEMASMLGALRGCGLSGCGGLGGDVCEGGLRVSAQTERELARDEHGQTWTSKEQAQITLCNYLLSKLLSGEVRVAEAEKIARRAG